MFDDQQKNPQGNIPANLPIGSDAEDIFAGTQIDQADGVAGPSGSSSEPSMIPAAPLEPGPVSAVDAGILRPKQPVSAATPTQNSVPPAFQRPAYAAKPPEYPPVGMNPLTEGNEDISGIIKEPIGSKKVMLFIILAIVFLVFAVGGAWIYFAFIQDKQNADSFEPNRVIETDVTPSKDIEKVDTKPVVTSTETVDENIIFGDTIPDTDSDSLDDVREDDLGTDPLNWDTDGDELGDGDEVIIWKTKPLDPDTDNDSFSDGQEVKNGYNPLGNGKLFEPPSTVTSTASTTAGVGVHTTATSSATST